MKQLKIKSRVMLDKVSGKVITQVFISKSIVDNQYNQGLRLRVGWHNLTPEPECPQPPPVLEPGQYGEYICVNAKWVFIPA